MLTFDEATHTYTLDGIQLPSVTEVTRFCAYDYKTGHGWRQLPPAVEPPFTKPAPSSTTARSRRKRRRSPDT